MSSSTRGALRARLAAAALLALACAGPPPLPEPVAPAHGEPVGGVQVAPGPGLPGRAAALLEEERALAVLRQSTLDWLEQGERLDPRSELEVRVEVESLELRSPAVAWLFSALAGPDRLAVRVELRRRGDAVRTFHTGAASALSGFAWRDRGERLRRLARRVGHRVAGGL